MGYAWIPPGKWKGEPAMIHIALCDNEPEQRQHLSQMVQTYLENRPELIPKLHVYASPERLLSAVKTGGDFDLYLLDVLMPGISGIELGLLLRKMDCEGEIIYITASQEYALDSYRTHADGYLLKPLAQEDLDAALDHALGISRQKRVPSILVKTKTGVVRLAFDDILYVELVNRTLCYHLRGREPVSSLTLRTSFQQAVEPLMEDPRFFRNGSSFAVNLYYVQRIEKNGLYLDGGICVPLTRGMQGEASRRWSEFWLDAFPLRSAKRTNIEEVTPPPDRQNAQNMTS